MRDLTAVDGLLDGLLEWGELGGDILRRVPEHGLIEIATGTPIHVPPGQVVLVWHQGAVVGELASGRHDLGPASLPGLSMAPGDEAATAPGRPVIDGSAARAAPDTRTLALAVVNSRTLVKRWGTRNPLTVRGPGGATVQLRAHGEYALRVTRPPVFVSVCVGEHGIGDSRRLEQFLRDLVVGRLRAEMERVAGDLASMQARLGQITRRAALRLEEDFDRCGLELGDLAVHGVVLPDAAMSGGHRPGSGPSDGPADHDASRVRSASDVGLGHLLTRMQVLTLATRPDGDAEATDTPRAATVDAVAPHTAACARCDRQAPVGAHFCPWCGLTLAAENR